MRVYTVLIKGPGDEVYWSPKTINALDMRAAAQQRVGQLEWPLDWTDVAVLSSNSKATLGVFRIRPSSGWELEAV